MQPVYSQKSVNPAMEFILPGLLFGEAGSVHFPDIFFHDFVFVNKKTNAQEKKQEQKISLLLPGTEPVFTVLPGLVIDIKKPVSVQAGIRLDGEYAIASNFILFGSIDYSQNAEINYPSLGYRFPFGNIFYTSTELKYTLFKDVTSGIQLDYLYEESPGTDDYKFLLHKFQSEISIHYSRENLLLKFSCINFLNKTTHSQRQKFQMDLFDPGAIEETDPRGIFQRNFRICVVFS